MSIIWKYDCEWYWTAVCVWHKWWMSFLINVKYQIYFSSYVVLMMCNFRIGTNSLWYLHYIYASSWHETSSIDSGFLLCDYILSKTIWNAILLYNACTFMRSFMERLTVCDIYIYIYISHTVSSILMWWYIYIYIYILYIYIYIYHHIKILF